MVPTRASHWLRLLERLRGASLLSNGARASPAPSGARTSSAPNGALNSCCSPRRRPLRAVVRDDEEAATQRQRRPGFRFWSSICDTNPATMSNDKKQQTQVDTQAFDQLFGQLSADLTQADLEHPEIGDAIKRLKEVVEYNVPGGKRNRGLSVITSFRELASTSQQTEENVMRALVVGWCVELLQAFFLVADDLMDQSTTRRGQLCWYKKENIGNDAINDSFLLEATIYRLLKKYCQGQPYYLHLLELFLETSYQTELGQALDLMTAQPNKIDLSIFTEHRYKSIVKYKTAYYSFYLPVAAAMYIAGIESQEAHEHAKSILLEMGEFFQIQDDYLDCFGDPEVTGKIGTDIEDNKCSWLVVQALQKASPEQKIILEENYGRHDVENTARVKELYTALELERVYHEYEETSYRTLMLLIKQHAGSLPEEVFLAFARKIYKRQK